MRLYRAPPLDPPLPTSGWRKKLLCCRLYSIVVCPQWTNGTSGQAGRASEHGHVRISRLPPSHMPSKRNRQPAGRPNHNLVGSTFLSVPLKVLMRCNTTAISRESYGNLRQSMHTVARNQAGVSVLLELVIQIWLLATLVDVSLASC